MEMTNEEIFHTFRKLSRSNCGHFDLSSRKAFEEIIDIAKPKNILEIGFHAGHSAVLWLGLSDANLTSVDPAIAPWLNWDETQGSIKEIESVFPNRFTFVRGKSQEMVVFKELAKMHEKQNFDLVSIDGLHEYDACCQDINLALTLGAEYVFLDDYTRPNTCVIDAVAHYNDKFDIVKIWSDRNDGNDSHTPLPEFGMLASAPLNAVLIKRK